MVKPDISKLSQLDIIEYLMWSNSFYSKIQGEYIIRFITLSALYIVSLINIIGVLFFIGFLIYILIKTFIEKKEVENFENELNSYFFETKPRKRK